MALIGHPADGPRTVTFGKDKDAPGATEGAYRTARLYARIGTVLFGVPAAMLTVVAIIMLVDFATDLAATWAQAAKLTAIAVAMGLASTGLPAWAGLVASSSPKEGVLMMQSWGCLLAVSGLALIFFVARLDGERPLTEDAKARIEELRRQIRVMPRAEFAVWQATSDCSTPQTNNERAVCARIAERDNAARAEIATLEGGWSPASTIGTGKVGEISEGLRRLIAALFTLLAMAGAGMLARWGSMGHAEAMRQADGIVTPPAAAQHVVVGNAPALTTPLDTVELWFQGRVMLDANGRMNPNDALDDYLAVCSANGQPPMAKGSFFNLLSAKAKASAGAVTRGKSHGKHVWLGWSLATADMGALPAPNGDELIALPFRN
jgi:hypothetical protein